jgi:putative copper resistance protein D
LVAALTAAILLTVDGHSASGEEVLQAAVIVHVVAALLWTGGLAALVVHVRHRTADLAVALPRFSRVAGWSYLAVAACGVLAATAVLPMSSASWTSGYGGIVLAKVAVLGLLGIAGAAQRRVTMVRIAQGRPRSFVVVGTAELALMGIATGLASTLSRSPAATGVAGPHGHLTASGTDLTWAGLVTDARPNAVVLVTLAAALAWYVAGVRALRRARGHWATRLTACFTAGVVLVSVATCSGLATQAHLRPSALVTQLMLVLVVVPVLLIGGRPERLGLVRWAPAAASPASGAVASCTLLLLLQHSSLASWALASPWRHLALVLAALACGLLLWAPVLAPRDHGTPHLERAGWLLVVAATLAILTARLRTGTEVLAGESFLRVQLSGVDVVADQQRAALASGVAAAFVILCAVATALRRSGSGRDHYPGSPGGQARMRTTPRSSSASIAP